VAVFPQSQGKADEGDAKNDRICGDGPDQPKCASPWGNEDNGTEQYREHAPEDQHPLVVNLFP
jgi:hypothetical protein